VPSTRRMSPRPLPEMRRKLVTMQSTTTIALVHSAQPPWDALRVALAAQPDVQIVGDIGPTQPLGALAGRHPTVMLVDADLPDRPTVTLVRDLRALSPAGKVIVLGATATLDGAALITLHDQDTVGKCAFGPLCLLSLRLIPCRLSPGIGTTKGFTNSIMIRGSGAIWCGRNYAPRPCSGRWS